MRHLDYNPNPDMYVGICIPKYVWDIWIIIQILIIREFNRKIYMRFNPNLWNIIQKLIFLNWRLDYNSNSNINFKKWCTISAGVYYIGRGVLYRQGCTISAGVYYIDRGVLYRQRCTINFWGVLYRQWCTITDKYRLCFFLDRFLG